ncbi:ThiF family adenylyltransferase [Desulfosporosinus burensis]
MSQKLISLNKDLKKLRDEGYEIEEIKGFALVHDVPYVNSQTQIGYGTLITNLTLSGDCTCKPDTHVMYFRGEAPCHNDGTAIVSIINATCNGDLGNGITYNHTFSSRPANGYDDYYHKFTTYINILSGPAFSLDNFVTAKTFKVIETPDESVLNYCDTNSSRAEIGEVTCKLENQKIGIIGLGGTGSYVLDLVAKTPVSEIHLYDNDKFLSHNAFRAPGAPSIERLRERPSKTEYFQSIYGNMHKYIHSHPYFITEGNISELFGLNLVFICMDKGKIKRQLMNQLIANGIPFIDAGLGIDLVDNALTGHVRVTVSTPQKNDHLHKYISFADGEVDDYSTNIQIAELNALNASLAVIKWKKLCRFYYDFLGEHHNLYSILDGVLLNEEKQY